MEQEKGKKIGPVTFASWKFNEAEINHAADERELLAAIHFQYGMRRSTPLIFAHIVFRHQRGYLGYRLYHAVGHSPCLHP